MPEPNKEVRGAGSGLRAGAEEAYATFWSGQP